MVRRRWRRGGATLALALALFMLTASVGLADHESSNLVVFAPVAGTPTPAASGGGTIDFRGGAEPRSRWTLSLRLAGLAPMTAYTVVVQGRFGADNTPEAAAFSPVCTFRTDGGGEGRCWNYFLGLRRAGVVQVREGDVGGRIVAQASRAGGPGSITSQPNRFSPR